MHRFHNDSLIYILKQRCKGRTNYKTMFSQTEKDKENITQYERKYL
ncbi:hypothetical protein M099_3612 [Phocaeicola vulgatus str. 3975 RP4]|uniref:Uncharacterized protein n=3 Tax=Phocaeicola TaxID=909656 RepID=A0A078R7I6_PHOVU|nr:hypothetical protein BACDOR_02498 [Phocaeicola dorei DSM 17855]EEZ20716.1 hypothetical protein HMPREF0105_2498 [Bacteroides sp. 3_1_33FAA]KDS31509.1 hypothetical protein M097_2157 [Phocaeicola vulgatus str. 3775 SL(B) 10 (iv)]KDS40231.1 hypothetical protein M098_3448 [Phocaeicola vulgatus str. 3775 SR(B) 19]KDS46759.1 hypothetical protein M099_3612 [Phocaeicola vulgatus str. 3975 RP4]